MPETKRRRATAATFGNVAYNLDYYGDVVAAPRYAPQPRVEPRAVPQTEPKVAPRVHERARVRTRVRVREQQAVAPFAICGFLAAVAITVVLLLGYTQLNSVYAETVQLQNQLTALQTESANLEARYEEAFDRQTLEAAVAADGTLRKPAANQTVFIDMSEPDNAVVYNTREGTGGVAGFFQAVRGLLDSAVEYFR